MTDIRYINKLDMDEKFEPLQPKIAENLPECGNELIVIDVEEIMNK